MSILGNDISSWQEAPIDFAKMKSAGCQFLYIRAGVGWTKDRYFDQNKAGAREAGIPWGSYWIPWVTQSQNALLDNYEWMLGDDWGDLPPALDVETKGLSLAMFIYWLNFTEPKWLARIPADAAEVRRKLVFYTRASHFNQYTNVLQYKQALGQRTNLWVAHYTHSPLKLPALPKDSWSTYLIHQYSADENSLGSAFGVQSKAIDVNSFNGDAELYLEWIGVQEGTPLPPRDRYIKIVAKKWDGQPGFLFFRDKPEWDSDAFLAVGYGEVIKLVDTNIVNGHWHVNRGGFDGWVSASPKYTQLLA